MPLFLQRGLLSWLLNLSGRDCSPSTLSVVMMTQGMTFFSTLKGRVQIKMEKLARKQRYTALIGCCCLLVRYTESVHVCIQCKSLNFKWIVLTWFLNSFTPKISHGDIKVILSFEFVDKILWCDHSNETSSAVLSHGDIYF